jgi:hypothetical protein
MHSHDRTMIAKLGFADPDKREPLHELACQFLTQPDIAAAISKTYSPRDSQEESSQKMEVKHLCPKYVIGFRPADYWVDVRRRVVYEYAGSRLTEALTEVAINKGSDQYKTTIGFVDVRLTFERDYLFDRASEPTGTCRYCDEDASTLLSATGWPTNPRERYSHGGIWHLCAEVKIQRTPISDCIRQIGLYRSYGGSRFSSEECIWMIVTPWPLTAHEMKCLTDQGIRHLRLGEKFETFCSKAKELPAGESALTL